MRRSLERLGSRTVHDLDVVQGHFAGVEDAVDGLLAVHLDRDLLASRQQVVLVKGVDVLDVILVWDPGRNFMHPLLRLAGENATQAVITSSLLKPQ